MILKFQDHLPLYRLEQIAARDGVNLSRSTLTDWVGRLGVALLPLADRLAWHLLQRNCLHAHETPAPQLDPGNGKLNGLDPTAWLKDILEKLPTWPSSRIDDVSASSLPQRQKTETLLGPLEEKGMQFYFLPPYSPELNRIDLLWHKMKTYGLNSNCIRRMSWSRPSTKLGKGSATYTS
jgi:transposase